MERHKKATSPEHDASFQTLVVIQFCKNIKQELMEWMVTRLRAGKSVGGAELLVRVAKDSKGRVCETSELSLVQNWRTCSSAG